MNCRLKALCLAGLLTVTFPAAHTRAQDGTLGFNPHVDYTIGARASALAVGDFNRNSVPDIVTANQSSNTISVLLLTRTGVVLPHVDYAVGPNPSSVAVGDFNGDGKLDLAVANASSGTVSVLLGRGDGTFLPRVDYIVGFQPESVSVGDFNGNGRLDIVTANQSSSTVSILLGNGDGTFQPHVDYPTGSGADSVVVGDFNHDGQLDLAAANYYAGTVSVLLGNGNGSFQPHVDYAVDANPTSAAVGDFNRDGSLDLAVADAGNVSILLGSSSGAFQAKVDYPVSANPAGLAVADLTSDGKLDLAVTNYGSGSGNTVSVLTGNGDGTFQPHVDFGTGSGPWGVVTADFNLDGQPDLAVANYGASASISVLANSTLSPTVYQAASTLQYTLAGSNGVTWVPVDTSSATPLQLTVTSPCSCRAELAANASMWTYTTGFNQDLGIQVGGGIYGTGMVVAWEESGGATASFSPNAAAVLDTELFQKGVTYTFTLVMKANNPMTSSQQISIGAGPVQGHFSPTSLVVHFAPLI